MVADLKNFAAQGEKILESLWLVVGISEQCGGVESAHEEDAALLDEFAELLGDLEILVDELLSRDPAEADDYFRAQQPCVLA